MDALNAKDAEAIHTIVLNSADATLIEKYEAALTAEAKARKGLSFDDHGWRGIPVSEDVKKQLDYHFRLESLHQQQLLSHDGAHMELRVLASALPSKIVGSYFSFDPYTAASKSGIDYEAFKKELKSAYKGTVGRPGSDSFGILPDAASVTNNKNEYRTVLGLSMLLEHPYDKATVERLSLRNADDPKVRLASKVHERGVDPDSVFLVMPESSPLAIEVLAKVLNFQGSSHYLAQGIRR